MAYGGPLGPVPVPVPAPMPSPPPFVPVPPCVELPSFEAALALTQSRYSCLVVTPHRRHLALPPRFLHRKRTGIRMQLDAELRRYSESFEGVPVAYDTVKIIKELGDIIDDCGAIHLDIEANFVVFQPKPGKKIVGIINEVTPRHIACLVHGCFNVSIPKPDHVTTDEWKNLGFQIGSPLVFKMLCFDSDPAGMFCIRGRLCRVSIGEELPKENHKKKHKKHGDRQNSLEEMETDIVAAVTEGGLMQNHDIDNAVCDQTTEQTEQDKPDLSIHASDSSGYHSDHGKSKKKKRKLCEEETGGAGLAQPKSKKKRERNERMV